MGEGGEWKDGGGEESREERKGKESTGEKKTKGGITKCERKQNEVKEARNDGRKGRVKGWKRRGERRRKCDRKRGKRGNGGQRRK